MDDVITLNVTMDTYHMLHRAAFETGVTIEEYIMTAALKAANKILATNDLYETESEEGC